MSKSIAPALLAIALLSSPLTAQQSNILSGNQVSQHISGQSFRYNGHINGQYLSGTMVFQSNQSLSVTTDNNVADGGTWRVSGKQLCTRLIELRAGNETCFTLRQFSADQFGTSHGFTLKRQ